jgi:GT2 family glycosyltransferase
MAQSVPPSEILVVDNAGQPEAEQSLAAAAVHCDRLRVIRAAENTGPAGGHAAGLREFRASGRDLAWVMDDDCIPEAACLEALLNATDRRRAAVFVFPDWVTPDRQVTHHPAWCGFLISADIVEQVGFPRSELVWWGEDTEYLMWRIPAAGYARQYAEGARVLHLRSRATEKRAGWMYYYEARNSVYLRLRYRRNPHRSARTVGRLLVRVVFRENQRGRKLWLIIRGTVDGLRGRLGMRVPIGV